MDGMRWLALALALISACDLEFNSRVCGTPGNQWTCAETLACADPPTYCGMPPAADQCAMLDDFMACDLPPADHAVCVSHTCTACTNDLAGCPTGGTWKEMTSPTQQTLRALWVGSVMDAYAVGDAGTFLHYDGQKWTTSSFPAPTASLVAIWGSETGGLVVLANDPPAIYRLSEGVWSVDMQPAGTVPVLFAGLWGSAETDEWAVGLGSVGALIEHYDGNSWTAMNAGTSNVLNAVWGSSADDVWAVGASGTILHYQQSTGWTLAMSPTTSNLNAIDGSSATVTFAVGDQTRGPTVLTLQTTWQVDTAPLVPSDALAVWVPTANQAFLAGDAGLIMQGPTPWMELTNPAAGPLRAIKGTDATNVWAAGERGLILHYTSE